MNNDKDHGKGETVIIAEQDIDEMSIRSAIDPTGYKVISVTKETYEKKGLFRLWL